MSRSILLLLIMGCNPASEQAPCDGCNDTGTSVDTAQTADTSTSQPQDTSTQDTSAQDTSQPQDTSPPAAGRVSFVVLGDGGEGNAAQFAVANVVETVCARSDRGCEFALYLGDNIYSSGASSATDPLFAERFEIPYENLNFPFYVVLGNHDLGGGGIGVDFTRGKADFQVEYSQYSDKWDMEAEYYTIPESKVSRDPAQFFALNTTEAFFDTFGLSDQPAWLNAELAASTAHWKIAFGHHPYLSNGKHGNAGSYDDLLGQCQYSWMKIPCGGYVQELIENELCGQVDVYFSGHDHNRQWLGDTCGTTFVVSGAASKVTDQRDAVNTVLFEDYSTEGFLWVEIDGDLMTGYFYDKNGVEDGPFYVIK